MADIVLTTYPAERSRNVGDALITHSMIELVRARVPAFEPVVMFRETPLDELPRETRHRVFAPGFSVANGTYPALFPLFTDLDRMERFWPVGCSFQANLPERASFETPYGKDTLAFLKRMAERFGPFPCRDQLIVDRLERSGVPAFYLGDLALFDEKRIGTALRVPPPVGTLVITLQHHVRYLEQIVDLAKRVRARYPEWRRLVSMHAVPNPMNRVLAARMAELGYELLEVHGEVAKLDLYETVDLHVGYRLHGHLHFLRNRKPSILMVEDARSYGFSRTQGTAFGCVDAWSQESREPDDTAPERALALLDEQMASGFSGYAPLLAFIDRTHAERVSPWFDAVAEVLNG
ncbi:polysaccharide pyruvyl transferase family protein [Aureimonas populi]|uniref:Polysaccharide pyruvyl transferase family protein n=1 Tax=Aureimonas populi TaxID=1701758 RepID=A0ABW5CPL4_9HYPH|nr:polysaccharide pyruvyl transferase family protein [Aureimonas populi]